LAFDLGIIGFLALLFLWFNSILDLFLFGSPLSLGSLGPKEGLGLNFPETRGKSRKPYRKETAILF